jgi:carboxyl-terminal processing protease
MSPLSGRWANAGTRVLAGVVVIGVAFATGVVTGHEHARTQPGVLDSAAAKIAAESKTPVNQQVLDQAAMQGMLSALGDKWAAYYTPSEFTAFQDVLDGHYSGVGLWVRVNGAGDPVVTSVQKGSPAVGHLKVGDVILDVDGESVGGSSVVAVTNLLRGAAGTSVTVRYERSGRLRTTSMIRAAVTEHDVQLNEMANGILVIQVSAFTQGVGKQVRAAVASAKANHVTGIVLDLRDDPGGLLTEAVEVASAFLKGGTVVTFDQRGKAPVRLDAVGTGDTETPLVVLVDGQTASAAEIVTGALQDRDRAVIVGSRTFGKGSVQESTQLSNGSAVELTVGTYATPDGHQLDGVGIDPDIEVASTVSPAVAEQRALEVLSGLVASATSSGRG